MNENLICKDFCGDNEKNENGRCVKCMKDNCDEISYPKMTIQRKENL